MPADQDEIARLERERLRLEARVGELADQLIQTRGMHTPLVERITELCGYVDYLLGRMEVYGCKFPDGGFTFPNGEFWAYPDTEGENAQIQLPQR